MTQCTKTNQGKGHGLRDDRTQDVRLLETSHGTQDGFPWDERYGTVGYIYRSMDAWFLWFSCIGKYTVRPMDLMGLVTIVFRDASLVVSVVGLDHYFCLKTICL